MTIDRRRLLLGTGASLFLSARALKAEHHLISANPLITSVELNQEIGKYVPLDDFFVRDHYAIPSISALSLQIEGEVGSARLLTVNDLGILEHVELGAVLECAGSLVGTVCQACNGLWGGWRLKDLLALTKPRTTGGFVNLYGRDGYYRSVPIEQALQDGIVATHLNRRPLQPKHGAPARVVFPGWYGMNSVKWLERIVIAKEPAAAKDSYQYMAAKESRDGKLELQSLPKIQPTSLILTPQTGAVLPYGDLTVEGLAWSGTAAISKIEVNSDNGSWRPAQFTPDAGFEWVHWRCRLPLTERGPIELACRAIDENGLAQPEARDPQRRDPYANNWYHRIQCVVV